MFPIGTKLNFSGLRCGILLWLLMASILSLKAAPPPWWSQRGVTGSDGVADDYGLLNQGQLKQFALGAYREMEARLPNGPGPELGELLDQWTVPDVISGNRTPKPGSDDYAPVNLGQLKTAAAPFYQKLIQQRLRSRVPWSGTNADDYALANIGQGKNLFAFDLDTNVNDVPDWWELQRLGSLYVPLDVDTDGDGLTNRAEYRSGTDPRDYFNGAIPLVSIVSGNNQVGTPGAFLERPFVVWVKDTAGRALVGAPVVFSISSSNGGSVAPSIGGNLTGRSQISTRTGVDGKASVYFSQPPQYGVGSTVSVRVGNAEPLEFSTVSAALGQPTFFTAASADNCVTLSWNPVPGATGYQVSRSANSGSGGTRLGSAVNGCMLADLSVVNGVAYYYTVCATYGTVTGPNSVEAHAVPAASVRGAPAARPVFNPDGGVYLQPQTVTVSCATPGASLRYTTDGSEPLASGGTALSVTNGGTVQISGTTILRARAFAGSSGTFINSSVKSARYRIGAGIFTGPGYTLAVQPDGLLWSWGSNGSGQLGWGGLGVTQTQAGVVPNVSRAVTAAAGWAHSLAVQENGQLLTWGDNSAGQLADPPVVNAMGYPILHNRSVPRAVMEGAIAAAAGDMHSVVLKRDGSVWCFGNNSLGQVGDGTHWRYLASGGATVRSSPVPVVTSSGGALSGVIAVAAGKSFSLALKRDGTVWAWGSNESRQLGRDYTYANYLNGDPLFSPVAVPVEGLGTDIVAIAAGHSHGLALRADGLVLGWGRAIWAAVSTQVPAWSYGVYTKYLEGSGTVNYQPVAVGNYRSGSFGDLTPVDSSQPLARSRAVAPILDPPGGRYLTPQNVRITCATPDTSLRYTLDGTEPTLASPTLSNGGSVSVVNSAVLRVTAVGFVADALQPSPVRSALYEIGGRIAGGTNHSFLLQGDGTLWSWGRNAFSQLGFQDTLDRDEAEILPGLGPVWDVAAGGNHSLVVTPDARVLAWGANGAGQLGNGGVAVSVPGPAWVPDFSDVRSVSAGTAHSVALKNDGSVWTWGANGSGQLGNRSNVARSVPGQVPDLGSGVVAVAAGEDFTLALKADGSVWSWGNNSVGQLGTGSTLVSSSVAVQLSGLSEIVAIAAGRDHGVALRADGRVWSWGNNSGGQLGNGGTVSSRVPVEVMALSGVFSVAAGNGYTLALAAGETVYGWGVNESGRLSNAAQAKYVRPVAVRAATGAVAIGAGQAPVVLQPDGTVNDSRGKAVLGVKAGGSAPGTVRPKDRGMEVDAVDGYFPLWVLSVFYIDVSKPMVSNVGTPVYAGAVNYNAAPWTRAYMDQALKSIKVTVRVTEPNGEVTEEEFTPDEGGLVATGFGRALHGAYFRKSVRVGSVISVRAANIGVKQFGNNGFTYTRGRVDVVVPDEMKNSIHCEKTVDATGRESFRLSPMEMSRVIFYFEDYLNFPGIPQSEQTQVQGGTLAVVELIDTKDGVLDNRSGAPVPEANRDVIIEPKKSVADNNLKSIAWIEPHGADDGSGGPGMPQLMLRIRGLEAMGLKVKWKLEVEHKRRNGRVVEGDRVVISAPGRSGEQAWIEDDFDGGLEIFENQKWKDELKETVGGQEKFTRFFAGNAVLAYQLLKSDGSLLGAERKVLFYIGGKNPDDARCRDFITETAGELQPPMASFAYAIARHESRDYNGAGSRYNQFWDGHGSYGKPPNKTDHHAGEVLWVKNPGEAPPCGFGMFQITGNTSESTADIPREQLWNWQANVRGGLVIVAVKRGIATRYFNWIQRQSPQSKAAYAECLPPDIAVGSHVFSSADAIQIYCYNGTGTVDGKPATMRQRYPFDPTKPNGLGLGSRWCWSPHNVANGESYIMKVERELR
jgi:alpha-tubulin suppressor-like RCC1 family protein